MGEEMKAAQIIAAEIEKMLAERTDPTPKAWLVQHVMKRHAHSFADDFGTELGYHAVDHHVRRWLQAHKLDPKTASDPQSVLPGFDYVQRRYVVERDGESTIVPVHQLTELEVQHKVAELRRMAAGCSRHADELEKLYKERSQRGA